MVVGAGWIMISFFDLSSAGSVVRLASDTNGLSSTRARRGAGAAVAAAHIQAGGVCHGS